MAIFEAGNALSTPSCLVQDGPLYSYKWGYSYSHSYNTYEWPCTWGSEVTTLISGVTTLLITGRGPSFSEEYYLFPKYPATRLKENIIG